MNNVENEWDRVKTTERAFKILELIMELDGATMDTLATELNLAKSTIYRHINTLENNGYIVTENGEVQIGMRFVKFGMYTKRRKEEFTLATSVVEDLAEETGERAQFLVEEGAYAVYVHVAYGEHAVRTDPGPGSRIPIHSAAAGKAILGSLPADRVEEILQRQGLVKQTNHTITEPDELRKELEIVRDRGFAYNNEESMEGLLAIGAPIEIPDKGVLGAISISGPTHRMEDKIETRLPELLLGSTKELELNIQHL
jgi:DNA-binding IclR family transcriptional regulator